MILLKSSNILYSSSCRKICSPKKTIEKLIKIRNSNKNFLSDLKTFRIDKYDVLGLPVIMSTVKGGSYLNWGKGCDETEALVSGIMESVERYSARNINSDLIKKSKFNELENSISRCDFVLTNKQKETFTEEQINDVDVEWIKAYSLTDKRDVFLPANLIVHPKEKISTFPYDTADTNGMASGNSLEEAILHGLCEVIERHLDTIIFHNKIKTPKIDINTLKNPHLISLIKRFKAKGFELYFNDYTLDLGVPTISVFAQRKEPYDIIHKDEPNKYSLWFTKTGTSTDPEIAMIRALNEVVQHRASFLYVNKLRLSELKNVLGKFPKYLKDELEIRKKAGKISLNKLKNISNKDIKKEIESIIKLLNKKGCEVFVCDITNKSLGIPAVKVVIKGLQPPLGEGVLPSHPLARVSHHLKINNRKNFNSS